MTGLRAALGFLTRIPVGSPRGPEVLAVKWFAVVGAAIGSVISGVYAIGYQMMPSSLAALIAVVFGVLVTGALHEDGLADTADAIGSRAIGERGLDIMRDPRLGVFGTIAVVVSILWRVLAVAVLAPMQAAAGLIMAHALGRAGAVGLMAVTSSAREEGLGRAGVLEVTTGRAVLAVGSGCVIAGGIGGWWLLPALVVAGLGIVWLRGLAVSRFGGISGDVLGAAEQLIEISVLTVVAILIWQGSHLWWRT